jgi:hypothetical protein
LDRGDAVTQAKSNTLRLGSNSDVTRQLAIIVVLLFHRDIHQGILAEDTFKNKTGTA